MRIKIRTADFRFTFWFPTAWLFSRFGFAAGLAAARRYVQVPKKERRCLQKALRQNGKRFRGLTLVEVQTGEGETVIVSL